MDSPPESRRGRRRRALSRDHSASSLCLARARFRAAAADEEDAALHRLRRLLVRCQRRSISRPGGPRSCCGGCWRRSSPARSSTGSVVKQDRSAAAGGSSTSPTWREPGGWRADGAGRDRLQGAKPGSGGTSGRRGKSAASRPWAMRPSGEWRSSRWGIYGRADRGTTSVPVRTVKNKLKLIRLKWQDGAAWASPPVNNKTPPCKADLDRVGACGIYCALQRGCHRIGPPLLLRATGVQSSVPLEDSGTALAMLASGSGAGGFGARWRSQPLALLHTTGSALGEAIQGLAGTSPAIEGDHGTRATREGPRPLPGPSRSRRPSMKKIHGDRGGRRVGQRDPVCLIPGRRVCAIDCRSNVSCNSCPAPPSDLGCRPVAVPWPAEYRVAERSTAGRPTAAGQLPAGRPAAACTAARHPLPVWARRMVARGWNCHGRCRAEHKPRVVRDSVIKLFARSCCLSRDQASSWE